MKSELIDKIRNLIFCGQDRSSVLKINIIVSVLNKGVSFIVSFLLVTVTISYVNTEQYGIWLTITSISYWVSLFDFGLTHGLRNRLAEAISLGDDALAKKYVSTTYVVLSIIFIPLLMILLLLNHYILWTTFLNLDASLEPTLKVVFSIVISCFCVTSVLRIISTVFIADQRPALSAILDTICFIAIFVFIIILMKITTGNLVYLAIANSITKLIILAIVSIITFAFVKRYKVYRPSIKSVDFSLTKKILGLGGKFFVIQVSMLLIYQLVNFIITRYLGPENVTLYNVTNKYYSAINTAFIVFLTPFWSASTDAFVKHDYEWIKNSVKKLRWFFLILIIVQIILVIVSPWLMKIWLHATVVVPWSTNVLMALYMLALTYSSLYMYFINGIGKISLQMIIYLLYAVVSLPLMILGAKYIGLNSIIILTTTINALLIVFGKTQMNRILEGTAKGIWNK